MDDLTDQTPETLTRVGDLWFSKDMIVIRAENKIFHVFGGILAARSIVFRDMLAFPQPPNGDIAQIDGSPVVRLHDSADDVEVFLRAIYDSSYFMPAPAPIQLRIVLGILRLSHKYGVQYLHRRALDHLIVDGWYHATYDSYADGNAEAHLLNISPKSPINALSVIIAATEVGALWLLPYAYYCVSTFSSDTLLAFTGMEPHIQKSLLAHAHLVRGYVATNRFLHNRCANKICNDLCASKLSALLDDVTGGTFAIPLADTLAPLKTEGMCDECYEPAVTERHEAASVFWNKLPTIYGLQSWAELHAMKRAAMGEDEDVDADDMSD
ncbi:hypothetical protein B0H14DRAFT_1438680 [Mycena olivaceomarginata]|nr:hypothetical protein B0H14DRAFT_1438680 [Mycena olivaceomarginata]